VHGAYNLVIANCTEQERKPISVRLLPNLASRVIALTIALSMVLGLLAIVAMDTAARLYHQEVSQRVHADLARWLVNQYRFERDGHVDVEGIDVIFGESMRINPNIELYLLDKNGKIVAFNAPQGRVKLDHVDIGPVEQFLSGKAQYPIMGTDPRSASGRQVFSAAPIKSGDQLIGYVYVVVGGELYKAWEMKLRSSQILRAASAALLGIIVIGALTGFMSMRFVVMRLTRLAQAQEEFIRGGFRSPPSPSRKVGPFGPDEIDRLNASFSEMAQMISMQLEKLNRRDVQLRETMAEVSHDLRTPLTALGGYLDTVLLREELLSSAERRRYLGLAAAQQKRLTRLVHSQLELAMLESSDAAFNPQAASLSDLIDDVVQKLAPTASTVGLTLAFDMPPMPVQAHFDIGLIERVLENLLSNAIRHTPQGGTITVSVRVEGARAFVAVRDTGSGIDSAEQGDLFRRSSRARERIRFQGERAGLGLVISRRIVELHGGSISVESRSGEGAEFKFDLPRITDAFSNRIDD
jgi:signal transduction histidine kinase